MEQATKHFRKRDAILNAVNEQHGLRSPAQAVVCSLPIGQLVRL